MNKSNIILVGFMGSGKTTIGKELSKEINWIFLDLDQEIEESLGISIKEIFETYGENYFRKIESEKIDYLLNNLSINNHVISIGGGAFCNDININNLKALGITIYLKTSYQNLLLRYTKEEIEKRPLLKNSMKAKELLNSRERFYSQADFIINTDELDILKIKSEIINLMKNI